MVDPPSTLPVAGPSQYPAAVNASSTASRSVRQRLDIHRAVIQVQAGVQDAGAAWASACSHSSTQITNSRSWPSCNWLAPRSITSNGYHSWASLKVPLLQHRLQLLQMARGVVAGIAQRGDPGQLGRTGGQCQRARRCGGCNCSQTFHVGPRSVSTAADSPQPELGARPSGRRERQCTPLVSRTWQRHIGNAARVPGPSPGDLP